MFFEKADYLKFLMQSLKSDGVHLIVKRTKLNHDHKYKLLMHDQ